MSMWSVVVCVSLCVITVFIIVIYLSNIYENAILDSK